MKQLHRIEASRVARAMAVAAVLGLTALTSAAALAEDPVPAIGGFSTSRAPLGCDLIIYGSGFRQPQGQGQVLIGGRPVPVLAWADGAISVLVNPQAYNPAPFTMDTTYPVQVVVPAAKTPTSNTLNLLITSDPMVVGLRDPSVDSDDVIRIYGIRFGATQGKGYLTLTLTSAGSNALLSAPVLTVPVMAWSDNTIDGQLNLPAGTPLGTYTVTVHRDDGMAAWNTFTLAFK